ncbi:MAG: hypothetical protein K6F15_08380 [Treponema sp.]|nr:hypothetical protein [Treponema sp.]
MKKFFLISSIIFTLSSICFAQETEAEVVNSEAVNEEVENISETDKSEDENPLSNWKSFPIDFFITFEPSLLINTGDVENSAVSPIIYPLSFGAVFFRDKFISFQPRLSFFANYYIWYDGKAYPAEIENRTAAVFSFMLDLPAVYTLNLKGKHHMDFALGPAFNFRIITLANGVDSDDAGYEDTADNDVSEIRDYLWGGGNFFYLTTYTSYLYSVSDRLQLGPEFRFSACCGQLFSGNGLDSAILSFGVKAKF